MVTRLAFTASDRPEAQEARERLAERYGDVGEDKAQVIVALGGDGFMLETLHRFLGTGMAVYGMNCGSVGFLMNRFDEDDLPGRLARAQLAELHPLRMLATTALGTTVEALALNEVALLRDGVRTASIVAMAPTLAFRLAFEDVGYVLKNNPPLHAHLEELARVRTA